MRFYLGTHRPSWLEHEHEAPLFVSHRALTHPLPNSRPRPLPRAAAHWALDSGAFTEIARHGNYETSPRQYANAVARYRDEIGHLDWASPQDHMCEPWVLARSEIANTVTEAQAWTTANYLELRDLDATLPIIPVLQGQTTADYHRHADDYTRAGINLEHEDLVGIGSVCRRQATTEIAEIIASLDGLHLHGFGVKTSGLRTYGWLLTSADSMAWSYNGRRIRPCPEHPTRRGHCGNCLHHATAWHRRLASELSELSHDPVQLELR